MSTRVSFARPSAVLTALLLAGCAGNVEAPPSSERVGSEQTPPPATATSTPSAAPAPPAEPAPAAPPTSSSEPPSAPPAPAPEPEPAPGAEPDDEPADPVIIPDDGTLRIFPVGDSITLGVQGGYRNDLYQLLVDGGQPVDYVGTQWDTSTEIEDKDHEGHPGYTIANARAGIDGWIDAIEAPDVVLIMLGTNDEAWWTTKQPTETKDEMFELVDHVLERLPESVLVVATIPPQSPGNVEPINRDRGEMTAELNDLLRAEIPAHEAHGTRLFLADVNAVLDLGDLYDGIHPSREAHRSIAAVFHDVLKPLL